MSAAPGFLEGLTAIPGGSGLWASGAVVRTVNTGSRAVIWANGSV